MRRHGICRYKLFDVKDYTQKNKDGNDVVTLYDSPGGFLDRVDFYTAVVEVNRKCSVGKTWSFGAPTIKCYDQVKVIASVSWSFDPNTYGYYRYSGKADKPEKRNSMVPTLKRLVELSSWKTELCSSTLVRLKND